MMRVRVFGVVVWLLSAAGAAATYVLLRNTSRSSSLVALDVVLASVPMLLLSAITWRLVWPRWKLAAKMLLQPCFYAVLSLYIGHWTILVAWIHQGLFGLGGHIWFSRKHGFTWYAVEDPERYVALSKQMVGALAGGGRSPE
jgi:hypothetical protein